MRCDVLAIGTELLLGQIVNSNAATIGTALAESGLDAHFQQVVGDNLGRVEQALRLAVGRADAVVITGGIGPTRDDLTREAICALTGGEMRTDLEYAEQLRAWFERLGREMPVSNLRQAEFPDGAELIPNPKGTAPGLVLAYEGTLIFAIPGVPEEMEWLLRHEVLPRIRQRAGADRVLMSRVLRTWGMSEAAVSEKLDDLFLASANPSIAFLASGGEIKVRITAGGPDRPVTEALIEPVAAEVMARLGTAVFGIDDQTIEPVLCGLLEGRRWTIGTAESATVGMVAARIGSVPGASRVFRGSIVAYATDLKTGLLGIDPQLVAEGVVTEDVALAMAKKARERLEVDVAVAVTGSAGPDRAEREVGTMIVAVETPEGSGVRTLRMPGDRERVRTYTSTAALHLTRLAVTGVWW